MSAPVHAEVAIVGAGVVGAATALALARRGVSVALLEAEPEPGLAASGTNSGILHTGFDSPPGRAGDRADPALGAAARPGARGARRAGAAVRRVLRARRIAASASRARGNARATASRSRCARTARSRCPASRSPTRSRSRSALAAAAARHGAELRTAFRGRRASSATADGSRSRAPAGSALRCRVAVNCAGLHADEVARLAGDDSFEIYPRKGEFLVFEPPAASCSSASCCRCRRKRTKGVLVFPTIDGKVVAGPDRRRPGGQERLVGAPAGAGRDPAEGDRDVAAARGRGADRRLRRPAAGRARGELPDRPLARMRRAS